MLLVDDNRDLLHFLERLMADAGWTLLTAESATEAKRLMQEHKPNAALLDYMLPDGNGVELGVEFLQSVPQMLVIVMTGTILPPEEEALVRRTQFPGAAQALPGVRRDEPDPQPPDAGHGRSAGINKKPGNYVARLKSSQADGSVSGVRRRHRAFRHHRPCAFRHHPCAFLHHPCACRHRNRRRTIARPQRRYVP